MLKWVTNARCLESSASSSTDFLYQELRNEEHLGSDDAERKLVTTGPTSEAELELDAERVASCACEVVEDGNVRDEVIVKDEDVTEFKRDGDDFEELASDEVSVLLHVSLCVCIYMYVCVYVYLSIYRSICGIYIAPLQGNYSEKLSGQAWAKRNVLRRL